MNISEITTLIASLLAEQRIPALDEGPDQEVTEYLFATAGSALRFEVAEVVIRHDRQHPRALGLFLACACPLAQKTARRMMEKSFSQPPDLTEELLYHGAIDGAIRMFQRDQIRDELPFRQSLHHAWKMGAIRSAFRRTENKGVSCMGSVDHHARTQRMEQQFIARDMLDKIAALEPEPQTARLNTFSAVPGSSWTTHSREALDTEFKAGSSDYRFRTGHERPGDFALGGAAVHEPGQTDAGQAVQSGWSALHQRRSAKAVAFSGGENPPSFSFARNAAIRIIPYSATEPKPARGSPPAILLRKHNHFKGKVNTMHRHTVRPCGSKSLERAAQVPPASMFEQYQEARLDGYSIVNALLQLKFEAE